MAAGPGQRVLRGDESDRGTVLLDMGRIGDDASGVVEAAEAVVLVSRGGADALAHARSTGSWGLRLTYAPTQATVRAEISLDSKNDNSPRSTNNRGELVRVRGGIWTNTPRLTPLTTVLALA
ncbi:hypothetical protein SANT12839_074650 [Streptomyces antimycoticus]|uniref:Uncharacterized protein n=1 Tax=Streptomyces antimycoticus TaxID=68175 RepID=A0A4D4KL33_9ACTN|nr:hypothetical protein SANT12839_074650 [Streptomyces antimycoticus]